MTNEPTFSTRVKTELSALPLGTRETAVAECYGAFLFASVFTGGEMKLRTGHTAAGARIAALLALAFGVSFDEAPDERGGTRYWITAPEKLAIIFRAIGQDVNAQVTHTINFGLLENPACTVAFLRGAFLAGGSVTDPLKGYHLELVTSHRSVGRGMVSILQDLGLPPKDTVRRGKFAVYFKQSGAIEDVLTTLGATNSALHYMTEKVEKHMKNAIQRKVNCDTANVGKIVEAAAMQLAAIRRIEATHGLDSLPDKLHQTALLRVMNPEATLLELAVLADPPVSKSCMSHRLKKLVELGS